MIVSCGSRIASPRTRSVDNSPLPSARTVSNRVFQGMTPVSARFSHFWPTVDSLLTMMSSLRLRKHVGPFTPPPKKEWWWFLETILKQTMLMSWKKFFFMYLSTQALVRISLIFAYFNFSPYKQTYSWLLRPNWASSFTFCQYIKLIYFYSVFVNWMICSSKSKLIEMCSYFFPNVHGAFVWVMVDTLRSTI